MFVIIPLPDPLPATDLIQLGPPGYRDLKLTNDCAKRTSPQCSGMLVLLRRNGGHSAAATVFFDDYQAVHMIWHYYEMVQLDIWSRFRHMEPLIPYDRSQVAKADLTVFYGAEYF